VTSRQQPPVAYPHYITSVVSSSITNLATDTGKDNFQLHRNATTPRNSGILLPDNHRASSGLVSFSGPLQHLKVVKYASMSQPQTDQRSVTNALFKSWCHPDLASIAGDPGSTMGSEQEARSELASGANEAHEQINTAEKSTSSSSRQQSSPLPRSSLESIATKLPSYSEQSTQPPTYSSSAGRSSRKSIPPAEPVPRASPGSASNPPHGVSAASISAIMATSSSENDKMHSKRSKKVNDWNEDSTYKSRLAKMTGSGRNWNYFGADIEQYGNPFKRFGRKK
jgi:hypothetical protein